jgi:hypothetical protein
MAMTSSGAPSLDDRHAIPHTVGLRGGRVTASVTPWGDVLPGDGSRALEWHVADEDRWHSPRVEPSIRQSRRDGTPVIETRLRVRGGDVVQRIWVVADHGGLLVAEFENDSPSSVAVALTRGDVITQRPPTSQPVLGIELPAETVVVPIGHRATVRVALPLEDSARNVAGPALAALPGPDTVARGWLQAVETAARLVANDEPVDDLAAAVVDARCALLLGDVADPHDDPMGTLLDGIELVRMGEKAELWMDELVPLAEECFANHRQHSVVDLAQASVGMQDLLIRAGETRGARDVAVLWKKIDISAGKGGSSTSVAVTQGRRIAAVEQQFCSVGADGSVVLMPTGIADAWRGINFECYGLMAGGGARVSYALRWHGENAAIMWEATDTGLVLRSGVDPSWSASPAARALSGEALWRLAVR